MKRAKDKHQPSEKIDLHPVTAVVPGAGSESAWKPSPEAPGAPAMPPAGPVPTAHEVVAPSTGPDMEQLQDQLLRLRADFDNFKKRTLRDKAQLYETANQELMIELLPVLDHLQLAIQAATDQHADSVFCEGLQIIFDQLMGVLMKFGLDPFDAENQPFDPNRFEAVNHLPSDMQPEGIVIAQTRRGYLLKNRLLRPAQVIVSSGKNHPKENGPVKPSST